MIRLLLDGENIQIVIGEYRSPVRTAIENLAEYIDLDYHLYREAVQELAWEYPYFTMEDVYKTAEVLRATDPVSYHAVRELLDAEPKMIADENSAYRLTHILELPLKTYSRMQNIFEVAFDGIERATQRERYEKLLNTYPALQSTNFTARIEEIDGDVPFGRRTEFKLETLNDLRWLEVLLFFRQEKSFVRCECCWRYFVPKTKAATKYCYDDYCRSHGARLMRKRNAENDPAIAACDNMRHLLSERASRYEDAPPDKRGDLFPIDTFAFGEWSAMASKVRKRYIEGRITSEDFLRTIDTYKILDTYETLPKAEPVKSKYQLSVEGNLDFDPWEEYPTKMTLDLTEPDAGWKLIPSEELRLEDQQGYLRLKDEYGEK